MAFDQFNGPIPGENYTTDTKNFPWHRPPEYTDLDQAIEAAMNKLLDDENSDSYIYLIESGMDITMLTQIFLMSGVSVGKWSMDLAILMAGPVSHILVLMAKGYDVEYDLGIENPNRPTTSVFMRELAKLQEEAEELSEEVIEGEVSPTEPIEEGDGGFMGMQEEPVPDQGGMGLMEGPQGV